MSSDDYTHSSYLFFNDYPMQFSMRPCDERSKLKPVVEHGGGTITSKSTKDTIRLAVPGSKVYTDNCISTKWIWDCVKENKRLPMEKYIIKQDDNSELSDIDESDCYVKVKQKIKTKRPNARRREYNLVDDLAIINYIYTRRRIGEIKARAMWQDMEQEKIVKGRTWQSLKERFRKQIHQNIRAYDLSKEKLKYYLSKNSDKGVVISPTKSENSFIRRSKLYNVEEDLKILYYVLDENDFAATKGNNFWKRFEIKEVVERTWQSMRDRYLKHIIYNIKSYKIDKKYKKNYKKLLDYLDINYESSSESNEENDNDPVAEGNEKNSSTDLISACSTVNSSSNKNDVKKGGNKAEENVQDGNKVEENVQDGNKVEENVKDGNNVAVNPVQCSTFELLMEELSDETEDIFVSKDSEDIENCSVNFKNITAQTEISTDKVNSDDIEMAVVKEHKEISVENSNLQEYENLITLVCFENESGTPELKISCHRISTGLDQSDQLDERFTECCESGEEDNETSLRFNESSDEEMDCSTDQAALSVEEFAKTLVNELVLDKTEKENDITGCLNQVANDTSLKHQSAILEDLQRTEKSNKEKRKRKTIEEEHSYNKRLNNKSETSPFCFPKAQNPREKLQQKYMLTQMNAGASTALGQDISHSEPSGNKRDEDFEFGKVANRLEQLTKENLDEVDLNIKVLSELCGVSEDEIWRLLELVDYDIICLLKEVSCISN